MKVKMKIIFLITLFIPISGLASDKFSDNFDKLKRHISCKTGQAELVAKSNVNTLLAESAENYDSASIDILGWRKTGKSIVFKAQFKHNRHIDAYCEDSAEIVISRDCEFLKLNYIGHPDYPN